LVADSRFKPRRRNGWGFLLSASAAAATNPLPALNQPRRHLFPSKIRDVNVIGAALLAG